MTPEEWAELVREAVAMGLPGAAEAQFQLLLANAVTDSAPAGAGTPSAVAEPSARTRVSGADSSPTLPEEEPVEFDEDTTESRAERYIARKQGARPAQPRGQRRQPTLRPFDTPEDLAYQDVGEEQDEKESGPLSYGDGSISTSQR